MGSILGPKTFINGWTWIELQDKLGLSDEYMDAHFQLYPKAN